MPIQLHPRKVVFSKMDFMSTKKKPLIKHKSLSSVVPSPRFSLLGFLMTLIALLTLIHVLVFKFSETFSVVSPAACSCALFAFKALGGRSMAAAANDLSFLPLKDLRFADTPMDGHTWFMSSLNDTREAGEAEHLFFPSEASDGSFLCLLGGDTQNGTKNSYALARPTAIPIGAKLLGGLTFISDTYYVYDNLFHGLSAMVPFIAWHESKDRVKPARWILYHRGELRTRMSPWVRSIVESVFGEIKTEAFQRWTRPRCFEKAVVFRHNEGSMSPAKRKMAYDTVRCRSRAHCKINRDVEDRKNAIRLTLFLRTGPRSFKDEPAVIEIFDDECKKVAGCRLAIVRPNNLTFCHQVKLMTYTDILVSPHGAQLTNLVFLEKNSSLMEFFPKGWLKLAGMGQYVYQWMADSAQIKYEGAWRDPVGEPCPEKEESQCFPFYKRQQIGHDEAYFRNWTAAVLKKMRDYKHSEAFKLQLQELTSDSCSYGYSQL